MMTPWPPGAAPFEVFGWRIDAAAHAGTWDSGIGAELHGGRWNSRGKRVVYASLDPSTAIMEVAVHKGFAALDTTPNVLTAFQIADPHDIFVVRPKDIPNPAWLWPGTPSHGQQQHGDALLAVHFFVLIPSAVSSHSWNMLFDPAKAAKKYGRVLQEALAIDTRLNPAPPARP